MESEKVTEQYLARQLKNIGGLSFKWTSPNMKGVPDRICIFPDGTVVFVEVKSEGRTANPHQARLILSLLKRNANVHIVDTKAQVNSILTKYLELNNVS